MATDTRRKRNTLSVITLVVTLFVVVLYNLPGSRKPGAVTPGPVTLPESTSALSATAEELTAPALIADTDTKSHPINIEHWQTPRGAKVLFVAAPELPMLDVRLVFDAGAARNGDQYGLAAITSHLLSEGAGIYDVDAIARHFEGLGANLNTGAYRDMAIISLRTLSDPQYRDPALDVFYDVAAAPTFPEQSFERIRAQMLTQLEYEKQDPGATAQKAFYEQLYPGHPYGTPTNGSHDSLAELNLAAIRAFHQQYYVTRNLTIAIIGDISRQEADLISSQLDQRLPEGNKPEPLPKPQPLATGWQHSLEFPSSQTHINVGSLGIERGSPQWYALQVGNHIFGGGGFTSRLNQVIRQDNGLAYSVRSLFSPMAAEGPFVINLQTRNDQTQQALDLLFDTLKTFVEQGPTEEEIASAKRNILGSFPLHTASNSAIVDYLGMLGFYDLPLDYLAQYPAKVAAVTRKDVQRAFSQLIDPEHMLVVTVGQGETEREAEGETTSEQQ